ncbi:hypothetical protein ACIP69_34885 [Streptomyces hygroscopicus]|uniref:hypothetical protein n=1 Tax=Streptomyces hygroscopicus TaxID=1912 RepID=UPI0037F98252
MCAHPRGLRGSLGGFDALSSENRVEGLGVFAVPVADHKAQRLQAHAHHFARGRADLAFRTKPQLAAALAARGKEAGFGCRAVVADCASSVSNTWYLALREAGLAYVVVLKPHRGTWARADQPHTLIEAAHALAWRDARRPGDWTPVDRHFRDGHTDTWWAADARLGGFGPESPCRLVVTTTDPAGLLEKATWCLATNLPLWVPETV